MLAVADLRGADLSGARLGVFMPRVLMLGASLDGADLSDTFLASAIGLVQA